MIKQASENGLPIVSRLTVLLIPGQHEANVSNIAQIAFRLEDGRESVLVPLFVGGKLAMEFIADLGEKGKGYTPFELGSPNALESILVDLERGNVTHVQVNPRPSGPSPKPVAIGEVIDHLRNFR